MKNENELFFLFLKLIVNHIYRFFQIYSIFEIKKLLHLLLLVTIFLQKKHINEYLLFIINVFLFFFKKKIINNFNSIHYQ